MKKMLFLFALLVFILTSFSLFSDDLPLLAVPNIAASNVPEALAGTCRNMVETALLKTGRYTVLSYTDIEEILSAQAFSLSGCTDESCAIEIGKLLAADNIVVGELSLVAENHVLAIRLVNVTSGRTLSAEVVNIEDLSTLQEAAFTAAYALTGLKYLAGSAVTETGGLYILAPAGRTLEVFLDGSSKGFTPLLVEDIPFGVHLLEARAEGYIYISEISVASKDIVEITADTALLKGNLFLAVTPPDASGFQVFIDGTQASVGLLRDLPAGQRSITITGGGWYYQDTITVESGKTARLSASLLEAGTAVFIAPEGAVLNLAGDLEIPEAKVNMGIDLPTGEWAYNITHPDYIPVEGRLTVKRGGTEEVRPEYMHNEAWELSRMIEEAEADLLKAQKNRKSLNNLARFLGFTGVSGLAASGTAEGLIQYHLYNIEKKTPLYEAATDTSLAQELGRSIDKSIAAIDPFLRNLRNYSLVIGGSSLVASGIFFLLQPDITKLEEQLVSLQARLEEARK
ncbi:MAG: hypothetical protein JW760_08310 [Spirochaetales bacterium]|nr:hypothetical protein [Spirochaetales bacterium]